MSAKDVGKGAAIEDKNFRALTGSQGVGVELWECACCR